MCRQLRDDPRLSTRQHFTPHQAKMAVSLSILGLLNSRPIPAGDFCALRALFCCRGGFCQNLSTAAREMVTMFVDEKCTESNGVPSMIRD